MLAFAFLNPLLLWALPLAAVPIIIHLLNRRRFKIVPWAAMEYLLAALKRNRKRIRMEQWLVLLLRVLAVLLLVFLVSRPQLGGGGLLRSTTHHIVLLDDTGSMTQRSGSSNLFDKAQDRVREVADKLGQTRSGDLFSLVRTSRPTQPDLWAQRVGPDLGTRTGQLLKEMSVGDGTMELGELLQLTKKRAAEQKDASRTVYHLVTDLRAVDWVSEDDKPRSALVSALAGVDEGAVEVLPIGAHDTDNLAITAVRSKDRVSTTGLPTEFSVDVQNVGLDASNPGEVAVEVDGQSRVVQPVPQLAPGERASVDFQHTFFTAGFHRIDASFPTPADTFPLDDRRTLALEVTDRVHILLVDGDPGDSNEGSETFFLTVALDPGGDAVSGNDVQVVSDSTLAETDLKPFDMVWLCNVPAPSEAVVQQLEQFVAAGGGLICFLGGQVDVPRYNELLFKSGKGLLPLQLGEITGDPDKPDHGFLANADHPLVGRMPELFEILMQKALLIKRHLTMVEEQGSQANVMARVRDADGTPLIVTRTFGNGGGEVVVLGITADKHWSNMPDTYAEVVLSNQMRRFATKVHDTAGSNLLTREAYRLQLDPGRYKPDITVRGLVDGGEELTVTAMAPEAAPARPADGKPADAPPGDAKQEAAAPALLQLSLPMAELRTLGAYEVELHGHGDEIEKRMFARNLPGVEGRLVRLQKTVFQKVFPPEVQDRVVFLQENSGLGTGTGEGEIWRFLAIALLLGLLLESLLAWRFGRR